MLHLDSRVCLQRLVAKSLEFACRLLCACRVALAQIPGDIFAGLMEISRSASTRGVGLHVASDHL